MKYFVSVLLCLLLSLAAFGQFSITGLAVSQDNQALEFANVLLLEAKDSSVVALEMTESDGSFRFKKVKKGMHLVQISTMGYPDFYSSPFEIDKDMDLGQLVLQEGGVQLNEVVVKYKKPPLEQKGGTLVVNVASSIMANSGSAENVLKKVPGVMVVNGKISLAGQQGISILIDGRPTQYMDLASLLKDMPSDAIEKIEVMNEPDARFDAQGSAGVINIILKKNVKLGMNGSAYVSAGRGEVWRGRTGLSLNNRNGKWNFSNNLSVGRNSSISYTKIDRNVKGNSYIQDMREEYKPLGIYLKSSVDYYINKRHTVGTSINVSTGKNDGADLTTTTIRDAAGTIQNLLYTKNQLGRNTKRFSTDSYYQFDIDTSGQKLSMDIGYFKFKRASMNEIITRDAEENERFKRKQGKPSETDIYATKIDYVKPFGKRMKLQTGLKYSHVRIDNDLQAFAWENEKYKNDPSLSNHFIYNESLKAAYVKYSLDWKKYTFEAGVRYEDTHAKGYSVTLDSTTHNKIQKFFPSASVSGPITKKLGWVASYSYRINRPDFDELNPFTYYVDPYTYKRGNPFLKPELSHQIKASLTFKKQPFLNFQYKRTSDEIQLLTEQNNNTGIAMAYSENMNSFERYGASMFFPLSFVDGLSGYGGFIVNYDRYITQGKTEQYNESAVNFTGFLNANYEFTKQFSAEANFWYTGKDIEGVMKSNPLYGLDMGVQYKFLDDRAKLNLSVDALVYTGWNATASFNGFDAKIYSGWERRVFNLRFSYSFGNKHLKKKSNRSGSTSDEKNRNG